MAKSIVLLLLMQSVILYSQQKQNIDWLKVQSEFNSKKVSDCGAIKPNTHRPTKDSIDIQYVVLGIIDKSLFTTEFYCSIDIDFSINCKGEVYLLPEIYNRDVKKGLGYSDTCEDFTLNFYRAFSKLRFDTSSVPDYLFLGRLRVINSYGNPEVMVRKRQF